MVLTRRRPLRDSRNARLDGSKLEKKNRAAFVAPLTILLVFIGLFRIAFKKPHPFPSMPKDAVRMEEKVGLSLTLQKATNRKNVTMGPHQVELTIGKPCPDPRFVIRLIGDEALLSIPVVQLDRYNWKGSFVVPFPGLYFIEPRWYGCQNSLRTSYEFTGESTKLAVSGKRPLKAIKERWRDSHTSLQDLIPEGYWASPKLYGEMANKRFWISRAMGLEQPNFMISSTVLGESTVAKEATPIGREFGDLSNYELLCFVGSQSASLAWESFKSLRTSIAKNQKPFKFHYYPFESFREPDKAWDDDLKLRFRKCKILIISADELQESISQLDYKQQVAQFLFHMVKMFYDETFPIWMLTVNLPPNSNAQMCTSPSLKRTSTHPCNDVLFDMFKSSPFPERVRLLDNTDLTDPLLDEGMQDAIAIIAMRVFAIAADQVKTWRKAGQRGTKDGLQRNGVLEPNIDFPIYQFN